MSKQIIITGAAGFIGFNLCNYLVNNNYTVIGIDNLNNDLDSNKSKKLRLKKLKKNKNFKFFNQDIKDVNFFKNVKIKANFIIHLAASVSVRDSIANPQKFIDNNIIGFINILNFAKNKKLKLIYASSSSVYNDSLNKIPFSESEKKISPNSIYGITKHTNEKLAKIYFDKYNLRSIGLRFFTVYGEFPRIDMAIYKFIDKIYNNKKIELYNFGNNKRDFTNVKDIIKYISAIIMKNDFPEYQIFNIGSTEVFSTKEVVKKIEILLSKKANIVKNNKNSFENIVTKSSTKKIVKFYSKINHTPFDEGLKEVIQWYKKYKKN